jgi:putative transposase
LLWSFVYLVMRNLVALLWLLGRRRHSKEMEILDLCHELAILPGRLHHDRDAKFSRAFDEVFHSEGIKVIPDAGSGAERQDLAERWVSTVSADCLDRILILGRRHLKHVLWLYRGHYNEHSPHRALASSHPTVVAQHH